MFFEQQIGDTIGVRAGYVYKTEDDLISATDLHPAATR